MSKTGHFTNKFNKILIVLFIAVFVVAFFGPTDNWAWDPSFYYAQLRSPLIERDLDFRNETRTGAVELPFTATGLQGSPWPLGPGLLWAPFFLVAHALTLLFLPAQADGFSFLYIALVATGSVFYGCAALLIIYRLCRRFGSVGTALAVTGLALTATPLFYYMFRQPMMAHTTGLLAAAALVWVYLYCSQQPTVHQWSGILFGVTLGVCFLTRWNGLLMGFAPLVYFGAHAARSFRQRDRQELKAVFVQVALALALFLVVLTPQMVMWYRLYGSFVVIPQSGEAFVDSLLPVNLLRIFIDTNRGLLYWSPFFLLGLAGLGLIPDRRLRLIAVLVTASQLLLIGYRVDWYSGGGFGARYYLELLPFLALGVTCLVERLTRGGSRAARTGVVGAGVLLLLHQSVLVYGVEHGFDGWLDMASYFGGRPLGVSWQLHLLQYLLGNPGAWLAPRPFVGVDRQTILTNLLNGVGDPAAYLVTGTALAMVLLALPLWSAVRRPCSPQQLALFGLTLAGYFAVWALFLLMV